MFCLALRSHPTTTVSAALVMVDMLSVLLKKSHLLVFGDTKIWCWLVGGFIGGRLQEMT